MIRDIIRKNERLIDQLNEGISTSSVFHAYVIQSREPETRKTLAIEFIKAMLCHSAIGSRYDDERICNKIDGEKHEDLRIIRPQKRKTVSVEQIRAMQSRIRVRPLGERNIVLIETGDMITEVAQNALLKALEEPPGDTVIVILCENVENLISTVRSRCNICYLEEEGGGYSEEIREMATDFLGLLEQGAGYYKLKTIIDPISKNADDAYGFIDLTEEMCHERLYRRDYNDIPYDIEKTGRIIRAFEEARRKLDRGLTRKYVMKDLLLKIGG